MRIQINLASRPYVELDRLLRQLRIALGVLAVLAIALGIWLHSMTARARDQHVRRRGQPVTVRAQRWVVTASPSGRTVSATDPCWSVRSTRMPSWPTMRCVLGAGCP